MLNRCFRCCATGAARALITIVLTGLAASPALAGDRRAREVHPELVGVSSAGLARLDSLIDAAIRDGATPGAALAVGRRGALVRLRGYGRLTYAEDAPAVSDSTLYDLASLTKVVGTTSAIMMLVDAGRLDLDAPIYQYLRHWPIEGLHAQITLRQLLTHTSGLPAGADLWTTAGREAKISRIARMRLASPPGTQTVYSDLSMVVIGAVVESITGERLDDFLEREIFAPLKLRETMFNPENRMMPAPMRLSSAAPILVAGHDRSLFFEPFAILTDWLEQTRATTPLFGRESEPAFDRYLNESQIAPTEYARSRGSALRGVVHDPIAGAMDGVSGNAGLFSSARDLAVFAQMMLDAAVHDTDLSFASVGVVDLFVERVGDSDRALGWEVPGPKSSAGDYFAATSFGHTGYTGTSIWIDPEHDMYVVLLTNRVFPSARNQKHIALRRAVHDAVALAIEDEVIVARSQ